MRCWLLGDLADALPHVDALVHRAKLGALRRSSFRDASMLRAFRYSKQLFINNPACPFL
jgi:hypothetical protein